MQAPCRSGFWRRDENCRPCGPVLKYRCPRWSSHLPLSLPPASQQPRRRDAAAYLARHRACHAPAAAMPCSSYAAARALPLDRTCGASRQDAARPSSKADGALRQLRCIIAAAAVQVRVGGWSGQARAGGRAGGGTRTAGQRGRRGAPRPESKGTDVPHQLRRTIAPPPQRGTQLRPSGKRRQHENRSAAQPQGAARPEGRGAGALRQLRCRIAAAAAQVRAGGWRGQAGGRAVAREPQSGAAAGGAPRPESKGADALRQLRCSIAAAAAQVRRAGSGRAAPTHAHVRWHGRVRTCSCTRTRAHASHTPTPTCLRAYSS